MLPTTYSTVNASPMPVEIQGRLQRATELLEAELGEVIEMFVAQAHWQFVPDPAIGNRITLRLTAEKEGVARSSEASFTARDFVDDETALRSLRPLILDYSWVLSDLAKRRLDRVRKELERNLLELAGLPED